MERLRRMSIEERIAMADELSAMTTFLSRQAIREVMPGATESQVILPIDSGRMCSASCAFAAASSTAHTSTGAPHLGVKDLLARAEREAQAGG
ncbi:MAG TPA: hypothetical protein VFD82_20460 [Planctomycetota bacterium]|nr:hypothetical protein [Planctomycetota bacterium]